MEGVIYAIAAGLFVVLLFLPGRRGPAEDVAELVDFDVDDD